MLCVLLFLGRVLVFFRGVVWAVGLCGLWFVFFLVLGVGLCVAGGMSAPSQCGAQASATPRDDQPKPVRCQKNAGQDHFHPDLPINLCKRIKPL